MTESMKKKFEELNMTRDEIERFSEAMKKEEFRKLLIEYAEEISDPKNRELYEREITQLENERGADVTFIHPEPGFCMKTTQNGDKKCFVNVCKNAHIGQPTSTRQASPGGQSGLMWQIPHTCSQPREDVDKSGKTPCIVYDVVYHPDAYRMGETNKRFQKLLIDSAFDTVQRSFGVKLDVVNFTILKNLNFKGHPTASIIRKPRSDAADAKETKSTSVAANDKKGDEQTQQDDPLTPLIDRIKKEYMDKQLESKAPVQRESSVNSEAEMVQNEDAKYTIPKYRILHRGHVDVEDYANQMDGASGVRRVSSTRPKELVVTIELPLCKSAANVNLDIFDTNLSLESAEPSYKLELKFPFPVRSKEGKAKFDKSKRALSVTLPVVPFVENVEVMRQVNELPSSSELASSEEANASIASNDAQNQSSILMSPTSLSSSSSSLSNESFTNEDTLSALESSEVPAATEAVRPVVEASTAASDVKYTLPKKILVKETKNHINLKYFVPNYNRDSLKVKVASESQLSLTFDSTSSGGYVQYYATHVQFYFIKSVNEDAKKGPLESNDTFPYAFMDADALKSFDLAQAGEKSDLLKVNFVNDEFFEIKIRKRLAQEARSNEDEIEAKKVRVSVNKPDDVFSENLMVLDIDQELNVDEDLLVGKSHAAQKKSEQLNSMSKKDFILNFNKLVKAGEMDEDDDDDDDDSSDSAEPQPSAVKREERSLEPSKEQTKRMTSAEFAKFKELKEARKAQQQPPPERVNGCELLSEKIDEEPESEESDESPDMEKKYLSEMNENDAYDAGSGNYSRQTSSSLSSSSTNFINENQGLASSFNGSSSFNRLKSILKKPRSVSESESGALLYCHSMSNASTSSFGSAQNSVSDENGESLSASKKCVHFNKQVIRNVFKPGSTIVGMKKPNASKNKSKKNKRKRTISDPSHDASDASFRTRSISESSDDSSSAFTNSCESLPEEVTKPASSSAKSQPVPVAKTTTAGEQPSKKKKKNKNKGNGSGAGESSGGGVSEAKTQFDMETMLEWKNQGRLPNDDELAGKPKGGLKFKNKIMNDIED